MILGLYPEYGTIIYGNVNIVQTFGGKSGRTGANAEDILQGWSRKAAVTLGNHSKALRGIRWYWRQPSTYQGGVASHQRRFACDFDLSEREAIALDASDCTHLGLH